MTSEVTKAISFPTIWFDLHENCVGRNKGCNGVGYPLLPAAYKLQNILS